MPECGRVHYARLEHRFETRGDKRYIVVRSVCRNCGHVAGESEVLDRQATAKWQRFLNGGPIYASL